MEQNISEQQNSEKQNSEQQNNIEQFRQMKSSRIWGGFILVAAGFLLLASKMGAPIPGWLFTWPMILIAIGLLVGIKSKFRNPGAFIMILVGSIFLIDQSVIGFDFHKYIVPIILISVGLLFILRPRHHGFQGRYGSNHFKHRLRRNYYGHPPNYFNSGEFNSGEAFVSASADDAEYMDIHAVFGAVKKNIVSKNFKGGEIVSFMGGSEINFLQADIQHPIELEVHNVFGGTKLIIPSNWDLKNEISAVFGGVEDKRSLNNVIPDSNKKIVLTGACIFGGIEITNY